MDFAHMGQQALGAVIFSAIGIVVFVVGYRVIEKIMPFSVGKELAEDNNVALGIVMGAMMLGLAFIVAMAIR